MTGNEKIFIDFDLVPVILSGFADEAIAKLFVQVGPVVFMQRFELINVTYTVQQLIDRAISQRVSTGVVE